MVSRMVLVQNASAVSGETLGMHGAVPSHNEVFLLESVVSATSMMRTTTMTMTMGLWPVALRVRGLP